ncbi:ABC transporter ATP-binding protein [Mycetocola tolaasinivorans]|uniref:ABC transporter ATP-binding protein n=1 Tax=Mycetocola tolaasinivorans TaxID=76635 RepID=A0A3L7A508_9MICO|nr:ABC transporter ATP-binding protein [Mycetocola tolaasinivorans]RLP75028.1 ABC transporter ATP-binding protein [Mycetocola tolaasinivorans]
MTTLRIEDLQVSYTVGRERLDVVRGVSLEIEPGQLLAVVGESGSGKTTTAQAATGLLASNGAVTGGRVLIGEHDVTGWSEKRFRELRGRSIGWIPQDPNNSLNPVKRVGESVAEVLRIHRWKDRAARRARVIELLDYVGIPNPELRARQYPHELSGGMKQRVLIAGAIALEPALLIADEATSALDVTVQATILDLIDTLRRDSGTAVLMVTHDLAVAADRSDRLVVLRDGVVQEAGETERVLADPASAYTRRLLRDAPSFASLSLADPLRLNVSEGAEAGLPETVPAAHSAEITAENRAKERLRLVQRDALPSSIEASGDALGLAGHTATPAPVVVARNLVQSFGHGGDAQRAVDDVSFSIAPGSTHAIVGESGSGKTTTARIVLGFQRPTSGTVQIHGQEITTLRGNALRELRRRVQMVYQNPFGSLDPRQSIADIVIEPLRNFGIGDAASRRARAAEIIDQVALPASVLTRRPHELSGGQRQRVAIARALGPGPDVVVLDEAVSALDVTVQARILELLGELQRELGVSYLFISHDLAVVRQLSHTVSVLRGGLVVEEGRTDSVFDRPEHEYTRQLIAAIPGRRAAATGALRSAS